MKTLRSFRKTSLSLNFRLLFLYWVAISALLMSSGECLAKKSDFYQIQFYRLNGKVQEEKVDNYLKNAYLPALHRAGIASVGVFKPIESDTASGKKIIVWIPFKSLDHFAEIQDKLIKDEKLQADGKDFIAAPFNEAPYLRKESVLLKAFRFQPQYKLPSFETPHAARVYELRSYESPTEFLFRQKVKMFNEGGEMDIFKELKFNAVFYSEVVSGSTMPNLMYMTTFADLPARTAHWDAFKSSQAWKTLSGLAEYKNTVSRSVIQLLHPTDYSDF
ncbi:MAG: NIPSNAP family protein [Marinilabiliales bacterium]|nr:NIPSNAP family protein [Marinilabiliales bacterium]